MRRLKVVILHLCKALGLFHFSRWWTRDCVKILCYHGLALRDEHHFNPKLFMSPALFRRRMALLTRLGYRVVPLDQAVGALKAGQVECNTLVITVDDGFRSFYLHALPVLRQHQFPATVYVTSYYVRHANPVFRLILQYMFWKAIPQSIDITDLTFVEGRTVDLYDHTASKRLLGACIDHGELRCTEEQRVALSRRIGQLIGVDYEDLARSDIMKLMKPEQLMELQDTSFSVELHTHRHRFPADDRAVAQREIAENREALGEWLPKGDFKHFCYPSGQWESHQWKWLDEMNVDSATTCEPGLNNHRTPHHALHRFLDGEDVYPIEFEAALSGFVDLMRKMLRPDSASRNASSPTK